MYKYMYKYIHLYIRILEADEITIRVMTWKM